MCTHTKYLLIIFSSAIIKGYLQSIISFECRIVVIHMDRQYKAEDLELFLLSRNEYTVKKITKFGHFI